MSKDAHHHHKHSHDHGHHHAAPAIGHESMLSGYMGGGHSHDGGKKKKSSNVVMRLLRSGIHYLRNSDGFDEFSQTVSQVFPGIGQPIATFCTLGIFTPFVWLGVMGMYSEYKEAEEEYDRILNNKQTTEEKLRDLCASSDKWRAVLLKKHGLEIPKKANSYDLASAKTSDINKIAHHIVELETLNNKEAIACMGKYLGWTGLLGMTGMFTGMLAAMTAAGIEIAVHAQKIDPALALIPTAALELAGTTASTVAGSIFLGSQVVTIGYYSNRLYQGGKTLEALENSEETFAIYAKGVKGEENVREMLQMQQHFTNKQCECSKILIGSQAGMALGTFLSTFVPGGVVAGAPIAAIAAIPVIIATVGRIIAQKEQEKFQGIVTKFAQKDLESYKLEPLFLKHEKKHGVDCKRQMLDDLGSKLGHTTDRLAVMKELSLLHHVINARYHKPSNTFSSVSDRFYAAWDAVRGKRKDPNARMARLDRTLLGNTEWFRLNKKYAANQEHTIHGSGLEKTVGLKVRDLHKKYRGDIDGLLHLSRNEANKRIIHCALRCLDKRTSPLDALNTPAPKKWDTKKLVPLLEQLDLEEKGIYKRIAQGQQLTKYDNEKLARVILNKGKATFKAIRFNVGDTIIHTTAIMKCADELKQEEAAKQQAAAAAILPPLAQRKQQDDDYVPLEAGEDEPFIPLEHSDEASSPLMRDPSALPSGSTLITPSEAARIAKSLFEKKSHLEGYTPFKEIGRRKDAKGNEYVTYQDPFRLDADARIMCIYAPDGKLRVRYGKNATAVMPVQKITDGQVTGIEIHTIHGGNYGGQALAHHGEGESQLESVEQMSQVASNDNQWGNQILEQRAHSTRGNDRAGGYSRQ